MKTTLAPGPLKTRSSYPIAVGEMQGERGAARLLGIKPSTLRKRMTKLGVPFKFLPQRAAKRQIAPHQFQIG